MRLQLGEAERQRHQQAAPLGHGEHVFHQLAEALHLGPAELVDRAVLRPSADGARNRLRDVADEHRLEFRLAAADQRQRGRHPRERREAVEEIVLRAEHDRGAQDRRVRHGREHRGLALRLAARVERGRIRVGAERRDVDQPRAGGGRRLRDRWAPSACTASKRCLPRSNRMPTRLITTSAPRTAASTEAG